MNQVTDLRRKEKANLKTNRDTALSTYVNRLKEYILGCNETVNIKVAYNSVGDEVDEVIPTIEDIPTVIVGRSNVIKLDNSLGMIERERLEMVNLKPSDGSDTIKTTGRFIVMVGQIQIVVITRTQILNSIIASLVLDFNNRFYRTYYDVLFEREDVRYRVKELAFIQLLETREKEFSSSTQRDIALSISACEYEMKEQLFRLDDNSFIEFSEACVNGFDL
jgi:hypothetical protein